MRKKIDEYLLANLIDFVLETNKRMKPHSNPWAVYHYTRKDLAPLLEQLEEYGHIRKIEKYERT